MEMSEDWVDLVKISSADIDLDTIEFGDNLLQQLAKNKNLSTDLIIEQVIDIIVDSEDYASMAAAVMGYIWDSGITMETLFVTLAECCSNADLKELGCDIVDGAVELALTYVPPALIIKKLTDAITSTLWYLIVLKDISGMASMSSDFLKILYPTTPL